MTVTFNGAPDNLLTYTSPSPKLVLGPSGTYRYAPHNLYVNSASPANQSITVVSGADYTVVITGSVSVTASGAATGTWTAGTTNFTAATGTLTLGSTSGAGTVHVRRTNSDTTYLQTGASPRYGLPFEWNSSGVLQGILVEDARTNLLLRSSAFNNAAWLPGASGTGVAGSVSAVSDVAPNGATTVYEITLDRGAGGTIGDQSNLTCSFTAAAATSYAGSIWVKASAAGDVGKQVAVRHAAASGYTVITLTAAWQQLVGVETSGSAGTKTFDIANRGTVTSATSVTVRLWNAQVEAGAFATSPIETFGATVTRAADKITLATSAFPALGSAFGMVIESELLGDGAGYPHSARIYDVANNNIASNFISPLLDAKLYAIAGGVVSADLSSGVTITKGVSYKQAMSFEANRFAVSANGAAVTTDASGAVPSGMTTLALGGISALRIRKLLVVPHSYSDGQLQSLSA